MLEEEKITYSRRSKASKLENNLEDVVLLDKIGELSQAYSLGTVAFVGGSLVNVGGHNPLEPASFSIPVIMGKFHSSVRDIVNSLVNVGAMKIVSNQQDLILAFKTFLENPEQAGQKAKQVLDSNRGASELVFRKVSELVS